MNHSEEQTSLKIRHNYEVYSTLVDISNYFLQKKHYEPSAASAQIAASHAFINHSGIFASSCLEKILQDIGCNVIKNPEQPTRKLGTNIQPGHVLHVLTSARPTGGDTRYVWRWIQEDAGRKHSVVLTRQKNMPVPQVLYDALLQSGGSLYELDKLANNCISQAQVLRNVSVNSDFIAMHIFPDDIIPLIAFANKYELPPTVFINHSDHTFWLGNSVSDSVAHLRECSLTLSENRRGLHKEKIVFLPTPLGSRSRSMSINQAKQKLGYSIDTVLLLTIATAFKYRPIGETSLSGLLTTCLNEHDKVVLLAIGPESDDLDQAGFSMTDGNVVALGKRSDTAIFYEAADIYIDSYPFSSITSILEAGSYGIPVVTYCPYADDVKVLGAGAPGLTEVMFVCKDHKSYASTIRTLVEDEKARTVSGSNTMTKIVTTHCSTGWKKSLEELYAKTIELSRSAPIHNTVTEMSISELDLRVYKIYNSTSVIGSYIDCYAENLPYVMRTSLLLKLLKIDNTFSFSMFLPKWLEKKVSGNFTFCRRLPGIGALLRPNKC